MDSEIIQRLNQVFSRVLNDDISLTAETTAKDIEDWDSLNHVRLMAETEKEFGIKMSAAEIIGFKKVGDLIQAIERKKAK